MVTIIPAILATTEEEYKDKLQKIGSCPELAEGWVHIDLQDGKFTQNATISPEIIAKYPTNLKIELHLMVENPEEISLKLESADIGRVITHIEVSKDGANLAINPETPISSLEGVKLDSVLIMGVHPGSQGQGFIPETIEKIRECSRLRSNNNLDFKISVDGGVTPENAKLIVDAGADYLVVGSHLLEGNIDENLESFWVELSK